MDVSIYVLLQVRSKEVSRQISAGYYAVTAVEIFRYVIHMRSYITHAYIRRDNIPLILIPPEVR